MNINAGMIAEFHVATLRGEALADRDLLARVAQAVIRAADVIALGPPVVAAIPVDPELVGDPDDDDGLILVQPLTTSHLAFHTWPAQGRARVVLDACVPFEVDRVTRLLENAFAGHVVARWQGYAGLKWPEVRR